MTEQHPITPPPELRQLWAQQAQRMDPRDPVAWQEHVANQAARWAWEQQGTATKAELQKARDEELEACCKYISGEGKWFVNPGYRLAQLRAARRPKPQTLNSIALQMLGTIERDAHYLPEITDTIRRALNQLND
jgi:hypothetical protein